MNTADLDLFFETQRAHRDAMLSATEAMIESLYVRIADARVWIADLRRQSDVVLGAESAPADARGDWAKEVASFNAATGSLREQMISHSESLVAKFEIRIAELRAYHAALRQATDPLLGLPEDEELEAENVAKVSQIAAMLALSSAGDRKVPPSSIAWSLVAPWPVRIVAEADQADDAPSPVETKEAA